MASESGTLARKDLVHVGQTRDELAVVDHFCWASAVHLRSLSESLCGQLLPGGAVSCKTFPVSGVDVEGLLGSI